MGGVTVHRCLMNPHLMWRSEFFLSSRIRHEWVCNSKQDCWDLPTMSFSHHKNIQTCRESNSAQVFICHLLDLQSHTTAVNTSDLNTSPQQGCCYSRHTTVFLCIIKLNVASERSLKSAADKLSSSLIQIQHLRCSFVLMCRKHSAPGSSRSHMCEPFYFESCSE